MYQIEDTETNNSVIVGREAPNFALCSDMGEDWSLLEQRGKVTVLLFYPKDETLVCTKQMCSLRDNWEKYLETKAVIVGISPGMAEDHRKFAERHRLPLRLLADQDRVVTRIFSKHWLYPISFTRAVVVVDAEGLVRSRKILLRAFRPKDSDVITSIYAARGDALTAEYETLKSGFKQIKTE